MIFPFVISIQGQPIVEQIPKGINKYFDPIFRLNFDNCGLTSISAEDLEPFPELKMFTCEGNKIQLLDSDLFKFTPQLIYVAFSSNRIKNIGRDLILPLKQMATLIMKDNFILQITPKSWNQQTK